MIWYRWTATAMLTAILLLVAGSGLAVDEEAAEGGKAAEEPEAESAVDPLSQRGERLRQRIEERRVELRDLEKRLESAEGEDAHVLEDLITIKEVESLEAVDSLAKNVLKQEERGGDPSELRAYIEDQIRQITPIILERVRRFSASVKKLRAGRETAAPEDLLALEKRITKGEDQLQWLFEVAYEHLLQLEALEIQAGDEREGLSELFRARAETTSGRIRLARRERLLLLEEVEKWPDDAELKTQLDSLDVRLERDTQTLSATADLLAELGVATAEYRQLLIEATGEITVDVLDRQVAAGLVRQFTARANDWLRESAPAALFKSLFFALIVALFYLLSLVWRQLAGRALGSRRVQASQLLRTTLVAWVGRAIVMVGFLVGLSQIGVQLGPVLAGLGIAGFIVGFALQDTLSNFAAGAMILIYRPFDVGDVIEATGVFGTVRDLSLVNTTVLTFDNQTLVVPNNKIWSDVIRNVTAQEKRRVDLTFRVAYGENVERVCALLREVVEAHEKVLPEPEPIIKLHELGEWSMNFVVRPWTQRQDYWNVHWDLIAAVQQRLEMEGIRIPMPQREVRLAPPRP